MRINHIKPKVYIAVPCYDGTIHNKCASGLLNAILALSAKGWDGAVKFLPGDPVLESVRNKFVTDFMTTDCTHLFFIDSDVGFPANKFIDIIAYDRDVVTGCVPSRQGNAYAVKEKGTADGDLIGIESIGAAFMCINREVIEGMRKLLPELRCYSYDLNQEPGYNFFEFKVHDNYLQGEDIVFCQHVLECGFKIWADPDIRFTHGDREGNYKYKQFNPFEVI